MKRILCVVMTLATFSLFATSCAAGDSYDSSQSAATELKTEITTFAETTETEIETSSPYSPTMTEKELASIVVGKLSPEHEFYQEVVNLDPECADYINEISIYDEEIDDTFVVHLSLPPEYDSTKKYPMIVMTDGVWRLSDHPELRPLMKDGEICPVIIASVGYPNGYDYRTIRERDLINDPESYLHFIVDNLVPYLSENYPVDSENMTLTGHSYGGYWAFYALFNSDTIGKTTFKNYYIGSPSFQARTQMPTGTENIASFEKSYYERNKSLDCNVYVTVGGLEESWFIKPITDFVDFFNQRKYEGLNLTYDIIEDNDHNHVFKPSIKNAMFMFYGTTDSEEDAQQ